LLEKRLAAINRVAPSFCMALRGYRNAHAGGQSAVADDLIAWLGGQPKVDEVETLQRMRGDVRDKALNALRQLMDEIDSRRFPGLYLVITGTPSFFEVPKARRPKC
jgi:hypothetical protein